MCTETHPPLYGQECQHGLQLGSIHKNSGGHGKDIETWMDIETCSQYYAIPGKLWIFTHSQILILEGFK